jgi:WG containing repeat
MSIYSLFGKIALISLLSAAMSSCISKSLSTPILSSTVSERETSLYEDLNFSSLNQLKGTIGIVRVRNKEVYFDLKNQKLLKPPGYFENISPFSEGIAGVIKNGKLGFINERGEWVISPRFPNRNNLMPASFYDGVALIEVENKVRFINKQGQFITSAFDFARGFDRGVAIVMIGEKYGLINKQGKFIISPQFKEEPRGNFTSGGMLVKIDNRQQCINNRGLQINIDACKYILAEGKPDRSAFEIENGSVYLHGKLLPGYKWDGVVKSLNSDTYRGIYIYMVRGKWGLVNESGKVITPAKFDITHTENPAQKVIFYYQYFYNGLAQAKINGKYGFIDETGKFTIAPKFDSVESFAFDSKITAVKLGGKWGAIDRQGNIVIAPRFESSFQFDRRFGSLAMFKEKNKYGFIDRQGKIVMPAQIDEIRSEDFANRPGADDFYDSLPNEGLVKARIGKKWGYVNTQGKIQIPMQFNEAVDFQYGVAEVKLGSRILYIDRQGKVLPF